jgi:hypothetical protein
MSIWSQLNYLQSHQDYNPLSRYCNVDVRLPLKKWRLEFEVISNYLCMTKQALGGFNWVEELLALVGDICNLDDIFTEFELSQI